MNDPEFFRGHPKQISRVTLELGRLQAELDTAYARWEVLESGEAD